MDVDRERCAQEIEVTIRQLPIEHSLAQRQEIPLVGGIESLSYEEEVIYGDTQFVYDNGHKRILKAQKLNELWKGMRFYHQSVFAKAKILKQNRFNSRYKIAADFDFLFSLYQTQSKFIYVGIVISQMSTGGVSYSRRVQAWKECREVVRNHKRNFKMELHYFSLIWKTRCNFFIRRFLLPNLFMCVIHAKDKMSRVSELIKLGILTKTFQLMSIVFDELTRKIYSDEKRYGFIYDLTQPIKIDEPKILVKLRTIQTRDITQFFNFRSCNYSNAELRKILECFLFLHSGISTCYVGVNKNNNPCVICWLIKPDMNNELQRYFKGGIPELKNNEVLCEYVYTHEKYRGLKLMSWVTTMLLESVSHEGFDRAIAYVNGKNVISLKTSPQIGWQPFLINTVRRRIFKNQISSESFLDE